MAWKGLINEFEKYLPVNENTPRVTLLEGNTPLIASRNLSKELGLDLYFKYEGLNPTGSFKDRGMFMAVAKAVESGSKAIMCASTGNTSASAAAYAAHCGIKCIVIIPEGNIAMGKLAQALIYGAEVIAIDGNFDDALDIVREITKEYPITLVNSVNPYRIEGQKTASFEICNVLGDAPDFLALPVGNAGNITAYWKGFKEYQAEGSSKSLPRMLGFQAAGSAPIVLNEVVPDPKTVATAIKIGNPASWESAKTALSESGGEINAVTDEEILSAQRLLASKEGVFCEPASAASLAGVLKLHKAGFFKEGDQVVCVLTGNGLKDPDCAMRGITAPVSLKADKDIVARHISAAWAE
jgi:threonine synthase